MARPTNEELQTELQQTIEIYNQALTTIDECKKRAIEIQAILKDRAEDGSTEDITSL